MQGLSLTTIEEISLEGDYAANPVEVALRFMQQTVVEIIEEEEERWGST